MPACLVWLGLCAGQLPAPPPVVPAPVGPPPVAVPAGPVLSARPAMTPAQFAATFRPAPGTYSVVLIHPVTHCPVTVCFTLPCGCPKKVKVHAHEIKFEYSRHEVVELHFKRDGTVRVH